MSRNRKTLTTLLSILGVTLLVACSSGAPASPAAGDAAPSVENATDTTAESQTLDLVGTWVMVEMETGGTKIDSDMLAALEEDGFTVSITLAADGTGAFDDGETDTSLTWEQVDDSHVKLLTDDGAEITGNIEGNQLTVDDGEGTWMVLEKDS